MKKEKLIASLLAILQLLLVLASCTGNSAVTTGAFTTETPTVGTTAGKTEPATTLPPATEPGTALPPITEPATTVPPVTEPATTVPPATEPGTTVPPVTEPPVEESPYIVIAKDGVAYYTVVKSVSGSSKTNAMIDAFIEELNEITGASFEEALDSSAPTSDKEILIRAYRNRTGLDEVLDAMTYTGYRVDVVGERILLSTYADHTEKLLDYLLDELIQFEDGSWGYDRDYLPFERDTVKNMTVPFYRTANGRIGGGKIYTGNENGYTVAVEKTDRGEFDAYLAKLEHLGYEKYAENVIGYASYYTYTKEDDTLHVQFIGPEADLLLGASARITLTQGEWLPPTQASAYTPTADARIINPIIDGVGIYGNGMNLVFQLSDGSFVLADGALYFSGDLQRLIQLIKNGTPAGKTPTISLWLWTHAHGDHVDLPRRAMKDFKNAGIDILAFGHNFPLWEEISCTEDIKSAEFYSDELIAETKKYYPDANEWVMHAGQRMYIADAVIECLWSHEDVHPMSLTALNDTCTVFSVTIDGIKTMVLGDCQNPNSKMIARYGEAMRSCVVQNSHHTLNGPKRMYEYIDPIISFWARDRKHGIDGECAQTEHGQYLLTTQWTRTDPDGNVVTGERFHYSLEEYVEYYIKDLKELYGHLQ